MRLHSFALLPAFMVGLTLTAQEGRVGRPRPTPLGGLDAGRVVAPVPRVVDNPRASGGAASVSPSPMRRRLPESSPILSPWKRERCLEAPTPEYWLHHDLMTEIVLRSRQGFIPSTPFPTDVVELKDYTWFPSGWHIYGFLVPPGASVQVALVHEKPAWFRLVWMDKWGSYRPGMKVRIGEPEARYENPEKETQAVYLLVDDPGFWSTESAPYTLKVTRNYDATKVEGTLAAGIWAVRPPVTATY